MILHYIKATFRQLIKHKTQTIISILGITCGLLCFSVCNYYNRIFSTGNKDLATYERQAEIGIEGNAYQVNIPIQDFEKKIGKENFEAVAFYFNANAKITLDETIYYKISKTECNADYFKVFPAKCVNGSLQQFGISHNEAVVTTDFVREFCGNKSPLGKNILTENGRNYTIIAVIEPYPAGMNNYHNQYDVFLPLAENASFGAHKILLKHAEDAERLSQYLQKLELFPKFPEWVPQIVLESKMEHKSGAELWIAILGILVLLVGMINYFSFSIGTFANRCKEISLRSTLGATYSGQFMLLFLEQAVVILISGIITLAVTESFLPWFISTFSYEMQKELYIDTYRLWKYECQYLIGILSISALVSLLSSWYITRKTAAQGLKGGTATGQRHIIRNSLLGFQLFFSLLFVIGTVSIWMQMQEYNRIANPYLSAKEKKEIMVLDIRGYNRIEENRQELISFLRSRHWNEKMAYSNRDYAQDYGFTELIYVSDEYFELMNIDCKHQAGEPFCYVNEQLYQTLQTDSTPEIYRYQNKIYPVKGLVHIGCDSPSAKLLAILPISAMNNEIGKIYIQLASNVSHKDIEAEMAGEINQYLPQNEPFEFISLYKEQIGLRTISLIWLFIVCSSICLLITMLGIYGAISIDTVRRQKEVAIRKINGARLLNIYWLFGKTYLILFLISSILGSLSSLFIMITGSQHKIILFDYANPWLWIYSLLLLIIIIAGTVSWQIYHIARTNPAEVIKNE
ncbi:ABC transporter permease [Bacteroides fragilis]|uniref:ABC transporter permease n=1 Tax=Bacteroides fragilis TaxID=817 RepID=UPI00202FEA12|nr:ABC transporter permease [Bacteroides fragilis]MCM0384250.1 ABC transporter permease [Bacteroides fragilis]